jgi:NAD(P)H dehydrogenase (quinone)
MADEPTVMISGAGGQLGRQVVELLRKQGFGGRIVAGTRHPAKLADLAAQGIEVRRLDWEDESSLAPALAGVDRLLLISGDQLPNRSENQVRLVNAATAAGVKHITYTSMVAPERYQHIPIAPSHLATEQALKASGLGYAILQNLWYPDQLIETLKRGLASGRWDTSAPDGKVAYVSREDCARVAAAVLAAPVAPTGTFVITGPEAASPRDLAALATELTGKPIEVGTLTDEQVAVGLRSAKLPEFVVTLVTGIDGLNREGGAAAVSGDFEKLTGTKPTGVRDWLRTRAGELAD